MTKISLIKGFFKRASTLLLRNVVFFDKFSSKVDPLFITLSLELIDVDFCAGCLDFFAKKISSFESMA